MTNNVHQALFVHAMNFFSSKTISLEKDSQQSRGLKLKQRHNSLDSITLNVLNGSRFRVSGFIFLIQYNYFIFQNLTDACV